MQITKALQAIKLHKCTSFNSSSPSRSQRPCDLGRRLQREQMAQSVALLAPQPQRHAPPRGGDGSAPEDGGPVLHDRLVLQREHVQGRADHPNNPGVCRMQHPHSDRYR